MEKSRGCPQFNLHRIHYNADLNVGEDLDGFFWSCFAENNNTTAILIRREEMEFYVYREKEMEFRMAIPAVDEKSARFLLDEYIKKGDWFLEQVI